MTLENYTPEKLDLCALRLIDIVADLRAISQDARKKGLEGIPIHDKKALLWIENLEIWAKKSRMNCEILFKDIS